MDKLLKLLLLTRHAVDKVMPETTAHRHSVKSCSSNGGKTLSDRNAGNNNKRCDIGLRGSSIESETGTEVDG